MKKLKLIICSIGMCVCFASQAEVIVIDTSEAQMVEIKPHYIGPGVTAGEAIMMLGGNLVCDVIYGTCKLTASICKAVVMPIIEIAR